MSHLIAIQLDPTLLKYPDTDIRYALPDLLTERSEGLILDGGFDYVGDPPLMIFYLQTSDSARALEIILDVIQNVQVLENDLHSAVVGVWQASGFKVIFPTGYQGELKASFDWWTGNNPLRLGS